MLKVGIFIFLALVLSTNLSADQKSQMQIADEYFLAYETTNSEKLTALLADDAVFMDVLGGQVQNTIPATIEGKKAILQEFLDPENRWESNTKRRFELSYQFGYADVIVRVGTIFYETKEEDYRIDANSKIITIVTIKNQKVQEHRVYLDYLGIDKSMILTELSKNRTNPEEIILN